MARPAQESPKYTYTFGSGGILSVALYGIVHYLKARPWARQVVGGAGALCVIGFLLSFLAFNSGGIQAALHPNSVVLLVGGCLVFLAVLAGPDFDIVITTQEASRERAAAEQTFSETSKPEDAVEVDLKRLNEYYAINQSHARASFRWAIFAMLAGLATIITGIWLFYFRDASRDEFMAGLSTAAGIVANILSGVFLHLHNKTQEHAMHYYNQLTRVQRLALAIRLADSHSDDTARSSARDRVIDFMLTQTDVAAMVDRTDT